MGPVDEDMKQAVVETAWRRATGEKAPAIRKGADKRAKTDVILIERLNFIVFLESLVFL